MAGAQVVKVVQRCVADVARNPVKHVGVYVGDDLTAWHVELRYPASAPFTGGPDGSLSAADFSLYVLLRFGEGFPSKPPRLKFLSPWINHQHLWGDRICHSLLSDDFLDFFRERRTHGTSMWNAACALADEEGVGGMPRYLGILREFLSNDCDYDEEKHVKYDADSLQHDVHVQRAFLPEGLDGLEPLTAAVEESSADASAAVPPAEAEAAWGTDFFLKSPLVPGSHDAHPCFDVSIGPGRVPSLSTAMACLCPGSFQMGARTTDFGSSIDAVLPYPCSRRAWAAVGRELTGEALEKLRPLAESYYRLQLPGVGGEEAAELEAILGIVGEIWKTTCIGIVKEEGYESERAMGCFLSLHFLLLCLAEERPRLREHACATARQLLELVGESPPRNLKALVPDLGRFLARFLLAGDEVPLQSNAAAIVRELFSRNVRWVHPSYWASPGASEAEKQEQVMASFEQSQFGMKLTVFQSYYILRAAELGLSSTSAMEACGGRPGAETLRAFQEDCRGIKEMGSYAEFFLWLRLDALAEADVHGLLCEAVEESEAQGYNGGLPGR